MKLKRIFTLALAVVMLLPLLAGCNNNNSGGATSFTWWIGAGESTDYYMSYEENPVMKYIMEHKTFEDSEGNQVHIELKFQTPATGKEAETLQTLITTGSYPEIFDTTFYSGNITELYEGGIALDLTEYVEAYMPNYLAYIEAHPEYRSYFIQNVDGEEKYLSFLTGNEALDAYDQFYGWCYRRDWIVKYGVQPDTFFDPMVDSAPQANPNAGKAFSGSYTLDVNGNAINTTELTDAVNGDSWVDDVVFPSGNTDPIYISDWEWMMEIMNTALAAEGITDGYVMSLYFPGYVANGDLVTGFGGISPVEYVDTETQTIKYGAATNNFKAYLECMHQWYENGWIDKRFTERSGDMFFKIDDATVRQGKVGLWLGSNSTLGTRIATDVQPHTQGAVVYGARNPINDIYGDDEAKLKTPNCYFQNELVGGAVCVTNKASEKDIKVLCQFIDYLYSEEGAILKSFGLSKEQMAECQDETYLEYGLDEGAYTVVEIDGETRYQFAPLLEADDGNIRSAMTLNRVAGMKVTNRAYHPDTETYINSRNEWIYHEASGFVNGAIKNNVSPEDQSTVSKTKTRAENEYMYISVPQFITGELDLDEDWENFQSDLKKRNYQKIIDIYQAALDQLNG